MKKQQVPVPRFFLVILLCFTGMNFAFPQEKKNDSFLKYFNKTEANVGIGFGSFKTDIDTNYRRKKIRNDQIIFAIQSINGVSFSGRAGAGIGIGAEFWQKGMFYPVFTHLYYDFKKEEDTPFAFVNIGKAFGKRDSTSFYHSGNGELLFAIGAGYKMKVGKRIQFEYALFYRYQAISSTYTTEYISGAKVMTVLTDYKVPYNFGGFRISVLFR